MTQVLIIVVAYAGLLIACTVRALVDASNVRWYRGAGFEGVRPLLLFDVGAAVISFSFGICLVGTAWQLLTVPTNIPPPREAIDGTIILCAISVVAGVMILSALGLVWPTKKTNTFRLARRRSEMVESVRQHTLNYQTRYNVGRIVPRILACDRAAFDDHIFGWCQSQSQDLSMAIRERILDASSSTDRKDLMLLAVDIQAQVNGREFLDSILKDVPEPGPALSGDPAATRWEPALGDPLVRFGWRRR